MNKTSSVIRVWGGKTAIVALFLALQTAVPVALAAQGPTQANSDQSVENPGLLPTNPFYFLKSFVRSTQRALTMDPVKKATLELDILSQKAGELKKLEEVLDGSDENVKAATGPYADSVTTLQGILNSIKDSANKNQSVDQLLTTLLDSGVNHMTIFDALQSASDLNMRDRLESLDDRVSALLARTFERLDSADRLQNRISDLEKNQNGNIPDEMMLVESLGRVGEKLGDASAMRDALLIQKEHILYSLLADLQSDANIGNVPALFDQLPGNQLRAIMLVDELRERVGDSILKNTLNIVRQHLVDVVNENDAISKPAASSTLEEANRLIRVIGSESAGVKSASVTSLLSRAKFNATQANTSFQIGQYADAATQASAAIAAAQNALSYLARNNRGVLENEVKSLKSQYDTLVQTAQENGVSQSSAPQIMLMLAQAEKAIGSVSDLIGDKINLDRTVSAMRDADFSVEKADAALADLAQRIADASAAARAAQPLIDRVLPMSDSAAQAIKNAAIQQVQKAGQ